MNSATLRKEDDPIKTKMKCVGRGEGSSLEGIGSVLYNGYCMKMAMQSPLFNG